MLKIRLTITAGPTIRPEVIDIIGYMESSNMPTSAVVRTLYVLEKDYNMLHPEQRMLVQLEEGTWSEPSPAA